MDPWAYVIIAIGAVVFTPIVGLLWLLFLSELKRR